MVKNTGRRRLNIALLVVVAIISSVSGIPHNVDKQNFNTNNNNSALTKSLLQSARPYRPKNNANNDINNINTIQHKHEHKPKHRQLDDNVEITSSHTLKFSQCIDLQLLDKDLFDENVIDYTKNGQIMSTKSFALFHVCDNGDYNGNDCTYYESEDDLYMVDLSVFVQNVASYFSTVKSNYCNACDQYYYNLCVSSGNDDGGNNGGDDAYSANYAVNDDGGNGGDDAYAAGDDMANYYNGDDAARRLFPIDQQQRRAASYITCDGCSAYGCLSNDDDTTYTDDYNGNNANANANDQEEQDKAVLEMIEDVSQCLNTGINFNGNDLYVGFMCSPYSGDGVELAVFLDNECTVYTTLKKFEDIPSYYVYNDANVFSKFETFIKQTFSDPMTCAQEDYSTNPNYNPGDDDYYGGNAQNQNANNEDQVNDYCSGIFEDEGAVSFSSCSTYSTGGDDDQNQYYNPYLADDDEFSAYDWYEYDMTYEYAQDLDSVCTVVKTMDGEYYYHYDTDNSGTWNDHSGKSSRSKNGKGKWGFMSDTSGGFAGSGLAILLYVMIGVSLVTVALFVIGVYEQKKRERGNIESVYSGGRLV